MALSSIVTTIEADLRAAWTELETDVESISETVLQTCWDGIKPALTSIGPTLLADAVQIAQAAVAELGSGAKVGDVLTTMLGMAENAGKQAINTIEGNLLAAIASIHLSAAVVSAPAAQLQPDPTVGSEAQLGSTSAPATTEASLN